MAIFNLARLPTGKSSKPAQSQEDLLKQKALEVAKARMSSAPQPVIGAQAPAKTQTNAFGVPTPGLTSGKQVAPPRAPAVQSSGIQMGMPTNQPQAQIRELRSLPKTAPQNTYQMQGGQTAPAMPQAGPVPNNTMHASSFNPPPPGGGIPGGVNAPVVNLGGGGVNFAGQAIAGSTNGPIAGTDPLGGGLGSVSNQVGGERGSINDAIRNGDFRNGGLGNVDLGRDDPGGPTDLTEEAIVDINDGKNNPVPDDVRSRQQLIDEAVRRMLSGASDDRSAARSAASDSLDEQNAQNILAQRARSGLGGMGLTGAAGVLEGSERRRGEQNKVLTLDAFDRTGRAEELGFLNSGIGAAQGERNQGRDDARLDFERRAFDKSMQLLEEEFGDKKSNVSIGPGGITVNGPEYEVPDEFPGRFDATMSPDDADRQGRRDQLPEGAQSLGFDQNGNEYFSVNGETVMVAPA